MNISHVQANGLNFAYIEQGVGPTVFFLHGFPDNAWSYRSQMSVFAAAGYRVICPFLRGYTPTEIPKDGSCDPATLAKDLESARVKLVVASFMQPMAVCRCPANAS
jgi:pimeloyl-ACP methyl ester carboxylesterase